MMNIEIIRNKRIIGNKKGIGTIFILGLLLLATCTIAVKADSPAAVNLGTAGNYVILAETTITTTGTTRITGDIGLSPAAASYFTGFSQVLDGSGQFSTSSLVTGRLYAADYTDPTLATLTTAVTDMGTAYTTANSQSANFINSGTPAGTLPAQTLPPGVYRWISPSPNVGITGNIILSGGPSDVWIFQIPGTLVVDTGVTVTMSGGATYNNVFWVVGGQTTIHAGVTFNGIILDYTSIAMQSGATLIGRALAQAAVTLDSNIIGQGVSIESCRSDGVREDTFIVWDTVYAKGSGFAASTTYPIYVVSDVDWADGMAIPSRVTGSVTTVTSDALGGILATSVWPNAQLGKYDIVVDVNSNHKYDAGIDALDNNDIAVTAGFFVVPETPIFTTLIAVIAAGAVFIAFKKRSNFHS